VAVAVATVALKMWPHAPLEARVPLSAGVWSADGELLRVTLSADDQYRLWVPLDQIAPVLVDAVLLKEDRWFTWHPGVNPVSLARAAARTYVGGERQGGSTLTMQLARLLYRLNTRTALGKLRQVSLALWLERRYSKRELLEAYLNLAPFGGNIQGVGAASRIYFGKAPDRLTLGEALTLAVPAPSNRAGPAASEAELLAVRSALGREWLATHPKGRGVLPDAADADRRQADLPIVTRPAFGLPRHAPHFVDAVLAGARGRTGHIGTTLDAGLQRLLEGIALLAERGDTGVRTPRACWWTRDMSVSLGRSATTGTPTASQRCWPGDPRSR
jgi:penicillin-binding protein 1C